MAIRQAPSGFWSALGALDSIAGLPAPAQYRPFRSRQPVLVAVGLGRQLLIACQRSPGWKLAGQPPVVKLPEQEYSPAEIRQALQDLEVALDYLGQISAANRSH